VIRFAKEAGLPISYLTRDNDNCYVREFKAVFEQSDVRGITVLQSRCSDQSKRVFLHDRLIEHDAHGQESEVHCCR
jgi:hypothetical protein